MYEVEFIVDGAVEDSSAHGSLEGAFTTLEEWVNQAAEEARTYKDNLPVTVTLKRVEELLCINI